MSTPKSVRHTPVIEAANRFGFELFKVFVSRHKNEYMNLCFSPLAVFKSLAMVLIGAKNKSESQLASVLHLNGLKTETGVSDEMLKELTDLHNYLIKANHDIILYIRYFYVDKSVSLRPEFEQILRKNFEVKAKKVDFADIDNTVNIINNDSKESTDGVIDRVIDKRDLLADYPNHKDGTQEVRNEPKKDIKSDAKKRSQKDESKSGQSKTNTDRKSESTKEGKEEKKNVKLILTNSIFFRGYWAMGFDEVTKERFVFGKNCEQSKEIKMIKQTNQFRYLYYRQLKAHIVSIPYCESDLRMVIILPEYKTSDGIYLIEYLNRDLFVDIMVNLQKQKHEDKRLLELSIPRFGLDAQKMSVQRTIKQMGAIDVFDDALADLSSMSKQKIHLTKLVHKSFILVDERGSGLVDKKKQQTSAEKPFVFACTHPFVFIIADKHKHVAVFMSYFGDPREMLEVVRESDLTPEQVNQLLQSVQSV